MVGSRRIVRTVATENKGVDEAWPMPLRNFACSIEQSAERQAKKVEHWKRRLVALAGEQLLERAVPGAEGEAALDALAREVAEREKRILTRPCANCCRARSALQRRERMKLGDLEFWLLTDGTFRLDGGAMFGVIPRPMWERVSPPDDRNRILMAMNSLLIRAAGKRILVETGAGDKWDAKRTDIYAFEGPPRLPEQLADARRAAGKDRHRHQHASAF